MKTLYTLLLLTAIGLGANAATNNNADKAIRVINKQYGSFYSHWYPTLDGGAFIVYNPRLVNDSLLITRLDASGAQVWTKNILDINSAYHCAVTQDNSLLMLSQNNDGNLLVKINATGGIDFSHIIPGGGLPKIKVEENGDINLFSANESLTAYRITAAGVVSPYHVVGSGFTNPFLGSAVSIEPTSGDVLGSTTLSNQLAALRFSPSTNSAVWAKTYTVSGVSLQPLAHVRLRSGNVVVCGLNATTGGSFVAKVDEATGDLLWIKSYDISFGSFTTTLTAQTYTVKANGFEKVVEMPNGDLALVAYCSFTGFDLKQPSALINLAADGSPISSYYVSNDVSAITSTTIDQEYRIDDIVNLNGDIDNYFLALKKFLPDSNTTALISLTKVPQYCKAIEGLNLVTDLSATSVDFTVAGSNTLFDTVNNSTLNVIDGDMNLAEEDLCFNEAQTLPTSIKEAAALEVSLLPNPAVAGKQAIVRLSDPSQVQRISIIDLSGKTLISTTDVSVENTISLGGIASGTYMVQLQGSKQTTSRQLIVIE